MNGLIITGDLTEDLYKFVEEQIANDQTGEEGFYLLGENQELKIEAEREEKGDLSGGPEVVLIIFEIVKTVGIKVLSDII